MNRDQYNLWIGVIPSLAMVAFTAFAAIGHFMGTTRVCQRCGGWDVHGKNTGKVLVAFWLLFPPVFLWADWVFYWTTMTAETRSAAEHLHDLARNIWLALVAVLTAAYGLKLGGGSEH
jgi:hypothetical protein